MAWATTIERGSMKGILLLLAALALLVIVARYKTRRQRKGGGSHQRSDAGAPLPSAVDGSIGALVDDIVNGPFDVFQRALPRLASNPAREEAIAPLLDVLDHVGDRAVGRNRSRPADAELGGMADRVAVALGATESPRALPALVEIYRSVKKQPLDDKGEVVDEYGDKSGRVSLTLVECGLHELPSLLTPEEYARVLLRAHGYGAGNNPQVNAALGVVGGQAAIHRLLNTLSQTHWSGTGRDAAVDALVNIGGPCLGPVLRELKRSYRTPEEQTRYRTSLLRVLGKAGDPSTIDAIESVAKRDASILVAANDALLAIAQRGRVAAPVVQRPTPSAWMRQVLNLTPALETPLTAEYRSYLESMDESDTRTLVDTIFQTLRTTDDFQQFCTCCTLVIALEERATRAAGALLEPRLFQHSSLFWRKEAVRALGALGAAAAPAIPHLRNALNDPEESVRAAARVALQSVSQG